MPVKVVPSAPMRQSPDGASNIRHTGSVILHSPKRSALLLFVIVMGAYASTMSTQMSLDPASAHVAAWNLVANGTTSIDALNYLEDHPLREVWVTQNGEHDVISRAPGTIAVAIPAYYVSHVLLGVEEFSSWPGIVTAMILTASAIVLMFFALLSKIEVRLAFFVCLGLGLGTPMWSVSAEGVWPHTLTALGIAAMAWAASRSLWWLVGLFAGFSVWGRVHMAFVAATLGLLEAWRSRDWRIAAAVGLPSIALLGLMAVWSRWMYGQWRLTGNYSHTWVADVSDRYPNLFLNELGLFFSLGRGIFVWTPVALLLIPAVWRAWRELPSWTRSLLWGGVVYTLVQGFMIRFQGGDSFWGYRLGIELVVCATPAVAFSLHRVGRVAGRLIGPVVVVQAMVMFLGGLSGHPGTPADRAWWDNPLISIAVHAPALGALLLVAAVMLGYAVPRVLARPQVDRLA